MLISPQSGDNPAFLPRDTRWVGTLPKKRDRPASRQAYLFVSRYYPPSFGSGISSRAEQSVHVQHDHHASFFLPFQQIDELFKLIQLGHLRQRRRQIPPSVRSAPGSTVRTCQNDNSANSIITVPSSEKASQKRGFTFTTFLLVLLLLADNFDNCAPETCRIAPGNIRLSSLKLSRNYLIYS